MQHAYTATILLFFFLPKHVVKHISQIIFYYRNADFLSKVAHHMIKFILRDIDTSLQLEQELDICKLYKFILLKLASLKESIAYTKILFII